MNGKLLMENIEQRCLFCFFDHQSKVGGLILLVFPSWLLLSVNLGLNLKIFLNDLKDILFKIFQSKNFYTFAHFFKCIWQLSNIFQFLMIYINGYHLVKTFLQNLLHSVQDRLNVKSFSWQIFRLDFELLVRRLLQI